MPSFRPRAALPLTLIAVVLAVSACGGSTPPAAGQLPPPEVTVVTLKSSDVTLSRELTGRVTPSLIAEVRPQVTGIVRQRLFTEGGSVRAGQALYQIDDTAFLADRNAAAAQVVRAQAALTTASLKAARSAELAKTQVISKQDNDNAQAALRQAQAELRAARAGVQGADVPLGFTRVSAPISGKIGRSAVTAGALVNAGQPAALATIHQLDPMYVDLTQSSAELLQLRREVAAGNLASTDEVPVDIVLEDGSRYAHAGRMSFAETTVDPTTGSFVVRVVVPNPDQLLLPGMYVRAVLANGVRRNALLVPQQGVSRDPKGQASAMVVDAEGKAALRPVKVSRTVGASWLVEDGLEPGDRVIVEGLQKIRPGTPVRAVEQGAAAASAK
jgi:membrane fusion protein (multidrug efflux system)